MSCRFIHQNPQSDRPDSSLQQHAAPPARLRSFADGMSFIFTSSSLISSLAFFLLHFGLSLPAVITITIPDTQLKIHMHRLSSAQRERVGSLIVQAVRSAGAPCCVSHYSGFFFPSIPSETQSTKVCASTVGGMTVLLCQCMHLGKAVLHFLENKQFIF